MADVFISYVEEDGAVAAEVASGLEAAGYQTWYYERDSLPGDYYTRQVIRVLSQARVVVVILSAAALASQQVDKELILAHEANKSFFPLLHGITHATFRSRRPDWAMMLGATVAVPIPAAGAAAIVPRLVLGLLQLGFEPGTGVVATPMPRPEQPPPAAPPDPPIVPPDNTAPPPTPPAPGSGAWYRGPAGWAAGLLVIAGLIGLIVILMNRAGDNGDVTEPTPIPGAAQSATPDAATPDAAATPAPSATAVAPTAGTTPGPTVTSAPPATSPSPVTAAPVSDDCSEMSELDESQLLLARAVAAACATEQAARDALAASPAAVASPDPAADCPDLAELDESMILLATAQAAACAATQAAE